MITINLKPGVKRAKGGSSLAGGLAKLKGLGEQIKDPVRLVAVLLSIGIIGFVAFTQVSANGTLTELEPKLAQARAENQRFHAFLAQKRRLEAVRDSIGAQILTIQNVDGDRFVWAHVLDEVARAVPAYTWLVDMSVVPQAPPPPPAAGAKDTARVAVVQPPIDIKVSGRTLDIQGYTKLLRQLEDSPYLQNVTAVSANTIVEQNRAVTAFVLRATYSKPGVSSQGAVAAPDSTQPQTVAADQPAKR
jgi:Tfp pilus assembly protein PilN